MALGSSHTIPVAGETSGLLSLIFSVSTFGGTGGKLFGGLGGSVRAVGVVLGDRLFFSVEFWSWCI